jgi:uncharacterized protein (TIGR03435 family)
MNIRLLAGYVCLAATAAAAVKAGDPAPPIEVRRIANAPQGASVSWEALAGKAVVLEFWATWCGPCIKQIPHLNELKKHFAGKPVEFLSLTAEDDGIVEHFLQLRTIDTWLLFDQANATAKAFGVNALPHTVLIDRTGRIAAITMPAKVTAEAIDNLLADRPPFPEPPPIVPAVLTAKKPARPLIELAIRPAESSESMMAGPKVFRASGVTLRTAIASAYRISADRIVEAQPLPTQLYEIVCDVSGSQIPVSQLLPLALEQTFGLKAHRETREMDVYLLRTIGGVKPELASVEKRAVTHGGDGVLQSNGNDVSAIARAVESVLHRPVIDDTKLEGFFAYSLYWDDEKPESVLVETRNPLGLELVAARRPVEVLVVETGTAAAINQ